MRNLLRCSALLLSALAAQPARAQTRVFSLEGFEIPESVQYDADLDLYFVSSIGAHATRKDNNGYISRVRPDGTIESLKFIAGGSNGVALHAPKGMAFRGDTLWVVDVDAVLGFHKRTGAQLAKIDLQRFQPVLPNDVAVTPDGELYITDTGLAFPEGERPRMTGPQRVYRRARNGAVDVVLQNDSLHGPNGALWHDGSVLLVALQGVEVIQWRIGQGPRVLTRGSGGFDGIVRANDGSLLVSSQDGQSIQAIRNGVMHDVVKGVQSPGDIGYDSRRNRVLVPLLSSGRVEVYDLNSSAPGALVDEEKVVLAAVNRLFETMRSRDTTALRAVFEPGARLVGMRTRPDGSTVLQSLSVDQFVGFVGKDNRAAWVERAWEPQVRIDGTLASVWAAYDFHFGNTFSHCGTDAVQLLKVGMEWKIVSIADTYKTAGCPTREPPR